MLLIYGALTIGGIETFFLRLAKERSRRGFVTKVLLLANAEQNNIELLGELRKYAEVYFIDDLYFLPGFISRYFILIAPINKSFCRILLDGVEHIHVANGISALVANRMISESEHDLKLSIGFYHSLEFSWGLNKSIPYFERWNRKYVLELIPKSNLFLFSDTTVVIYKERTGVELSDSPTFRLGVVERKFCSINDFLKQPIGVGLKLCSVGRLVDFKSYNLWMLDVVAYLLKNGFDVLYDIYGDGPLRGQIQNKIEMLGLQDNVKMMGELSYSQFDSVVSKYDIFIGSGTAIIQASALGIPSIIGIESIKEPMTFGFFCDFSELDYNVQNKTVDKVWVTDLLIQYVAMDSRVKADLAFRHVEAVEYFYMDNCLDNFNSESVAYVKSVDVPSFFYTLSYLLVRLIFRVRGMDFYKYTREP